jgi:hypothetical protein
MSHKRRHAVTAAKVVKGKYLWFLATNESSLLPEYDEVACPCFLAGL